VHTQQQRVTRDAFCVGRYTTWIGGSILASLSTFSTMWVTAQDYAADPQLIFKKFS
jgi:actin-related protein